MHSTYGLWLWPFGDMACGDEAELRAKVILAAAGDSEVTIEPDQTSLWMGMRYTVRGYYIVHGSVSGGAHARLERLSHEDPGQLLRLLERAEETLSGMIRLIVNSYAEVPPHIFKLLILFHHSLKLINAEDKIVGAGMWLQNGCLTAS